jgi:glycosyltransferase involved in cell wall biosynthesis
MSSRVPTAPLPVGRRSVLLAQPVHQHAYETAVALDRNALLHTFVTGVYDTRRGLTSRRLLRAVPKPFRGTLERELGRRRHPKIPADRVLTISRYHTLELALRRGIGLRRPSLTNWAQYRFDAAVGRTLKRFDGVQAVHAFEGAALETFRAARDLGVQTVLDVPAAHEYSQAILEAEGANAGDSDLERILAERELADWFVTPSDFVDECLIEAGVAPQRIVQIPYGVDVAQFCQRNPRDGVFRVLFVGSVSARKGVAFLLEAWRLLKLPNAELIVVGAPDERDEQLLRRYAGTFRHIPNVPRNEIAAWYRGADAFVFPTLADGFGLVQLEAMAAALPVVTTPNCGAVVRDGIDGFVVAPRDVDALCDRIRFLYENRDRAHSMGASGRRRVCTSFTWLHYAQRLSDFYRALLAGALPQFAPGTPRAVTAGPGTGAKAGSPRKTFEVAG